MRVKRVLSVIYQLVLLYLYEHHMNRMVVC